MTKFIITSAAGLAALAGIVTAIVYVLHKRKSLFY